MKRIKLIYILLFVCFTNIVSAQEPVAIHLTENDGLPGVTFYSMLEDKEGFIWFAANRGLYRYDGNEFKLFSHTDQRGRSVFNLKLDAKGRVWCNTVAGQFLYVVNNKLVLFKDFENKFKGRLVNFNILDNKLIIQDFKALFSIDIVTKQEKIIVSDSKEKNPFSVKDSSLIYINSKKYFTSVNLNSKKSTFKIENNCNKFLRYDSIKLETVVSKFYVLKDKLVLVLNERTSIKSKIIIKRKSSNKFLSIKLPKELRDTQIENIQEINKKLYIATNKGLFVTTLVDTILEVNKHFFKDKYITDILNDSYNNIWVSTYNQGIFIISNKSIYRYSNQNDIEILEKKNDTSCFVGIKKGSLSIINIKNNSLTTVFNEDNKSIRALDYNKSTDKILYASDLKYFIYNQKNNKRFYLKNMPGTKSVLYHNDSTYLFSKFNGTFILEKNNKKNVLESTILEGRSYKALYTKKNKQFYIADIEGLKVFDSTLNKYQKIIYNNKPIIAFNIIETLDGSIWVATYHKGVLKIKNNSVVGQFNVSNGLVSNTLKKIIADANGFWAVTNKGLQYYNEHTHENFVLTQQDGVYSSSIRDIAVVGNHILYANNFGLYGFNKTKIFKENKIPVLDLTKVFVQGKSVPIKDKYTLKHDKSNFKVNFNVKVFQSKKHIEYEYRLDKSTRWEKVQEGTNLIQFINLPIGEFTIDLRAKHKFEKKYSKVVTIGIKVLAPFYKRWWFYFSTTLLFFGVVYFIAKRVNEIKRKEQTQKIKQLRVEKQVTDLKLENLRSQMNPHFIFNSLNSIQALVLRKETRKAYDYIVFFSELVRKTLLHSEKDYIKLSEEIDFLEIYLSLESLRMKEQFSYELINKVNKNIKIPSLLIQPFLENAIHHGLLHKEGAKTLKIQFKHNEDEILCVIEDNGVGRDRAKEIKKRQSTKHLSFSLRATEKRLNILSKQKQKIYFYHIEDLFDEHKNSLGTKVTVSFPFKYSF